MLSGLLKNKIAVSSKYKYNECICKNEIILKYQWIDLL